MTLPSNLCLAPFTYMTFDPATNVSPCPALGGSVWNFKGQSFEQIWTNEQLTDFRAKMLNNEKHDVCQRCWNEEKVGMASERTMLWNPANDATGSKTYILNTAKTAADVLATDHYLKGPMQIVIKVGNVCNLRCRSCNSGDSITLAVEGKYYAETYGLTNNFYLKDTETKVFTDFQIEEIANFCTNVKRIEFYGGEPLLDKQLPKFLRMLVDRGLASSIQLNISTNITHQLSDELIDTLSNFEHLNISLSIDGWGDKFTYIRHPGKWDEVYDNIKKFISLQDSGRLNMSLLPAITVTSLNVYYLPELITNLKEHFNLPVFLILAWYPFYYSIKNIPDDVSADIIAKLQNFKLHDLSPIIEALKYPADLKEWDNFKMWTEILDKYRGESFSDTFKEYADVIKLHDHQER